MEMESPEFTYADALSIIEGLSAHSSLIVRAVQNEVRLTMSGKLVGRGPDIFAACRDVANRASGYPGDEEPGEDQVSAAGG